MRFSLRLWTAHYKQFIIYSLRYRLHLLLLGCCVRGDDEEKVQMKERAGSSSMVTKMPFNAATTCLFEKSKSLLFVWHVLGRQTLKPLFLSIVIFKILRRVGKWAWLSRIFFCSRKLFVAKFMIIVSRSWRKEIELVSAAYQSRAESVTFSKKTK